MEPSVDCPWARARQCHPRRDVSVLVWSGLDSLITRANIDTIPHSGYSLKRQIPILPPTEELIVYGWADWRTDPHSTFPADDSVRANC